MKLSVTFPELNRQREQIGAPISNWRIDSDNLDPREALLDDLVSGIEIKIEDIDDVSPGHLLSYKSEQVILYIKDTRNSLWTLQNKPEDSKRFHVAECKTLKDMKGKGRFERYIVTNRMDGLFLVDWLDRDTGERGATETRLKVCKNCLGALNWRGYERPVTYGKQQKSDIWENFEISEFLMDYSTFFRSKPSRRDSEALPNVYVDNWSQISEKKRREARWRCEHCCVDLSAHPGALHCHHKSGVVTDNSSNNLSVLCAVCHAEQPSHQHMSVAPAQRRLILAERTKQGIKLP